MLFTWFQFFPAALSETWNWKHDRRSGHHWATSDVLEFLKKSSLHYNHPYSTVITKKLKIRHLAVFLSCQMHLSWNNAKLNIPPAYPVVFHRREMHIRLSMRMGVGLKQHIAERDRILQESGGGGVQDWKSCPAQTTIGNVWIEIDKQFFFIQIGQWKVSGSKWESPMGWNQVKVQPRSLWALCPECDMDTRATWSGMFP